MVRPSLTPKPPATKRIGVMAFTCLAALTLTGAVGTFVEVSGDREAAAQQREQTAEEPLRRALAAMGWQPPGSPALRSLSAGLRGSHDVEIFEAAGSFELTLQNGVVTGDPAREAALNKAATLVFDEISLLPPTLVQRIGLRRVLLCGSLREGRRPIPSLPNYRGTLLLDVDAPLPFLRRLIHHEVFHFADLADDGTIGMDQQWAAINEGSFRYGDGGRAMRSRDAGRFDVTRPGFVSRYATSALEEDQAEVFAFLMTAPRAVEEALERDPRLTAKVERMRALMAALSDDMDEAFWLRIARLRGR